MSGLPGRNRAEENLLFTQFAVDHAVDGITWIGKDGRFRYVNDAFCRSLGYSRDELLSMTVHDIDPHFPKERWVAHWEELRRLGRSVIETVHRTKDGGEIPVEIAVNHHEFGEEEYHCSFIRNITERKKVEEALKKARTTAEDEKAKTMSILSAIGDGISIQDRDYRIIYQNHAAKKLVGDHVGEYCYKAYQGRESACEGCHIAMSFGDGDVHKKEQHRVTDEGMRYYDIISSPLRNSAGEIVACVEAVRDITEQRKVQALISSGKKQWQETFDVINDAITIHDRDFTVIRANKAAQAILGLSFREIIGQKCHRLYHGLDSPPEGCASCLSLKTGKPSTFETFEPHLGKYLEIKAFPQVDEKNEVVRLVHVIRDITEHKKMETEVLKAQKLESIGILAGGIAHDFNNLLQAMMGNISLAKMLTNPKEKTFPLLEEAEKASEQAKELSYRLLTFSKGGDPVRCITPVEDILRESVSLCLSGSNVAAKLSLPEDLDPVEVDRGQMNQVFNNLFINAKEAMPEGGTIEISAANVRITGRTEVPLKEGQYVKISVKDCGTGIPEEHLPKIFDPYFSTKERGSEKGMGLGLAICYSIIAKHGGHIAVESTVGVGTTFRIYLPASAHKTAGGKPRIQGGLPAGSGRVLFMDDDERVRRITGAMLQQVGYAVEFARNGEEAIERYRREKEAGKRIDAVILDLTVQGGMGGEKALRRLLAIDPEIKAVISSGYADDPVMKDFRAYGFVAAIAKPYTVEKLRELLGKL